MKVIFASRHDPTIEQRADVARILGAEAEIEVRPVVWADAGDVAAVATDVDILIGVFPQALALRIGWLAALEAVNPGCAPWTRKVWTAESRPAAAAEGEARRFEHVRFVGADGLDVTRPDGVARAAI